MEPSAHVSVVRHQGQRLVETADGRLDRPVPSCPGWVVSDLIWHVGIVLTFWRLVARGVLAGPESWHEPDRLHGDDLLAWYRESLDLTATTLGALDPSMAAWTWGRHQTVGFIARRLAHEVAVHCWDGLRATAEEITEEEPIERVLALDGIGEFLGEVLPCLSADLDGPAHTVTLRCTDGDDVHEWTVRVGQGSCQVLGPAPGVGVGVGVGADAVVTGTASDLLLLLWGRRSPALLEVTGDTQALRRFLARGRV
jgi:uncharacterized protein (TIGR03083 family)